MRCSSRQDRPYNSRGPVATVVDRSQRSITRELIHKDLHLIRLAAGDHRIVDRWVVPRNPRLRHTTPQMFLMRFSKLHSTPPGTRKCFSVTTQHLRPLAKIHLRFFAT